MNRHKKQIVLWAAILAFLAVAAILWISLRPPEYPFDAAVKHGYTGTREQWIAALVGEHSGYEGASAYTAALEYGYAEPYETWIRDLVGEIPRDQNTLPYYAALDAGFSGTLEEWLSATVPEPETLGISQNGESTQYEQACIYGFEGSFVQWLISLVQKA